MGSPVPVDDRKRMEKIATVLQVAFDANQNIIASKEPELSKLRYDAAQLVSKITRQMDRVQRTIAKMSNG